MKRIILMALLALALPIAAFAGNVDFTNTSGTLAGSSAGLTLTGSELTEVNGLGGLGDITGGLGSLSFTTGALSSGNLTTGAVFSAGGTFTITGNGTGGIAGGRDGVPRSRPAQITEQANAAPLRHLLGP